MTGSDASADLRPRSADSTILGLLLTMFGVFWLLRESGAFTPSWRSIFSVALMVLGVGLLVTIRSPGRSWMIPAGLAITGVLFITSAPVPEFGRVGTHVFRPGVVTGGAANYRVAMGEMTLDLHSLRVLDPPFNISAHTGFGELTVLVPPELDIEINARVRGGEISFFGNQNDGGMGVERSFDTDPTKPAEVVLDLSVIFGEIRVVGAPQGSERVSEPPTIPPGPDVDDIMDNVPGFGRR